MSIFLDNTTLDADHVLNPDRPLGDAEDGTVPALDVLIVIREGLSGGSQRTADSTMLGWTHAAQCRILRDIDRHLHGTKGVADRMGAHMVGYDDTVGRRGVHAVKFLTDATVAVFDSRTAELIGKLKSSSKLEGHYTKRAHVASALNRARLDVLRIESVKSSFRRTNLSPWKKPGLDKLKKTFLPASDPSSGITQPSVDDMLTVATYGLVNLAAHFHEFDYLIAPLSLAVCIGSTAVYGKKPDDDMVKLINELYPIVFEQRVPRFDCDAPNQIQQFRDVCLSVARTWQNLNMKGA